MALWLKDAFVVGRIAILTYCYQMNILQQHIIGQAPDSTQLYILSPYIRLRICLRGNIFFKTSHQGQCRIFIWLTSGNGLNYGGSISIPVGARSLIDGRWYSARASLWLLLREARSHKVLYTQGWSTVFDSSVNILWTRQFLILQNILCALVFVWNCWLEDDSFHNAGSIMEWNHIYVV